MKAPAFVVNISSEAACGYPLRNHCNTLSLSTTTQTHAHTWMQIYPNATHTHKHTHMLQWARRQRKKKEGEEEKNEQKGSRKMNECGSLRRLLLPSHSDWVHTHTQTYIHAHTPSFLTHSASSLPLLLPLPPSLLPPSLCRVYSPSILLGALLQSAHTLTPYCSHFSVFLFSLSLFPFLILARSLPRCVTFPTANPRLAHTQTEAYCCLLFYNMPGPPDHSHLARSCVHNFKNNTWNEEIINLIAPD